MNNSKYIIIIYTEYLLFRWKFRADILHNQIISENKALDGSDNLAVCSNFES